MNSGPAFCRKSLLLLFVASILIAPMLAAGCGSNTPGGAVNKYFSAWQSGDWESFKAAVVHQDLTKEQEALAKQKFEQTKVKFEGTKMTTEYNQKDKNKARVMVTDGTVTYTAKILGKPETETREFKKLEKEQRTYDIVKVNGVWYVDTKLG